MRSSSQEDFIGGERTGQNVLSVMSIQGVFLLHGVLIVRRDPMTSSPVALTNRVVSRGVSLCPESRGGYLCATGSGCWL